MLNQIEERMSQYLHANRDELLDSWMQNVIINPEDPFKDSVRINGYTMLTMLISFLNNTIDEGQLQQLAYKVSLQRLEANVNIGEYVYNVNIGRSQIISFLTGKESSIDQLHHVVNKINTCFDKFLYYTVQHYTEVKDQLLQEQTSYIEQTHKDRLTILGQMSSSFVHEFRNPLTSVIGFVQLLREKYPTMEYLDVLTTELNQLKFRINQFLMVSKKGVKDKDRETFNLSEIMQETLEFLYPMLVFSDVLVETDIDNSICLDGYRDEFRQVLINIIMNSLDALLETEHKLVKIKGYLDTANIAVISISNNGPAISKDKIATIFEPFVTTKKLGTGIGLYLCRKIIQEHNGELNCESDHEWTTFRISLPAAADF